MKWLIGSALIGALALSPITLANPPAVDWVGPKLNLAKFVDELPIPPRVSLPNAVTGKRGRVAFPMEATQFAHQFHRDLQPTQIWGYNKHFPGPTLEVESGQTTFVEWINHLPTQPLIKVTGSMPTTRGLPPVRTVVHLHGASVPEVGFTNRHTNSDGWPDAWNIPGESQTAQYPNTQEASGLWYHDHTTGITALNVYAGLAGVYLIRDAFERSLKLPSGDYEVPLVIQARSFNPDGSIYYPRQAATEFYGNTTVVNGKVWPNLKVEPRRYRFRVLNASNARTYALKLVDSDGKAGPAFHQIGSDGGFLEQTVVLNHPTETEAARLTLAPGERADIVIDFSAVAGKTFTLNNNSQTDDETLEPAIPDVMQIQVSSKTRSADASGPIPKTLRPITRLKTSEARRTRTIVLKEVDYPDGSQMLLLNDKHWEDPIVEKPLLNSVEAWNLVNLTEDAHPFHIHLVQFQVIGRRPFDVEKFKTTGEIVYTGALASAQPNEAGWKDTVLATPGNVTQLIIRFGPYYGHYVYHCHILEHEDMDMMRPFEVVRTEAETDPENSPAQRSTQSATQPGWFERIKRMLGR